jgi:hypothetical protein
MLETRRHRGSSKLVHGDAADDDIVEVRRPSQEPPTGDLETCVSNEDRTKVMLDVPVQHATLPPTADSNI